MGFDELRDRLAWRLGADLTERAVRVERVHIPMRHGAPRAGGATVPFGAAARYVHPATGYSVADTLHAAPRVATAIAGALAAGATGRSLETRAWDAVWPNRMRATRRLHDYGLGVLLGMGPDAGGFFDAFFDLPSADWLRYLRIDSSPGAVSATMWRVFQSAPWRVRRRLVSSGGRAALPAS
jgi:lycopene beta-cyclase